VAGNVDPLPVSHSWNVAPPAPTTVRIMAANLTSGNAQSYLEGQGIRIFQGLKPDIVLIQEFNYGTNTAAELRAFVDNAFGPEFSFSRQPGVQLPNGVISRFPILASGTWDDPYTDNREFSWALVDVPGPVDLWAVSLHLLTTSAGARNNEALALVGEVNAFVPSPPSDATLVEAARLGDRSAFAELLHRHRPMLVALIRRTLGDSGAVDDLAQEAAMAAWLGIGSLRQPERFSSWLAGIGLNYTRRWCRNRRRRPCRASLPSRDAWRSRRSAGPAPSGPQA
jgi:hypothetical protein